MARTMTPSAKEQTPMTDGQIDKAVASYRDLLKKHREEIGSSDEVQEVLGSKEYLNDQLTVIRRRVEAVSDLISRRVSVDRSLTPEQVIDRTGRARWYIDEQVLAEMPRDGFPEGNVEFFELDYDPSVDELDREYEARNLRPDPYAVAQAMADDPTIADDRPVAVQWRDSRKRACCAIFIRHDAERRVYVYRHAHRWHRFYLFAGVRK